MQARSTVQNIRLDRIGATAQPVSFSPYSTHMPASTQKPATTTTAPAPTTVQSTSQVEPQMLQATTLPPASTTTIPESGSVKLPWVNLNVDPITKEATREVSLPQSADTWNILPAGENSMLIWLGVGAIGLYIANKRGLFKTTKRRRK